MDLSTCHPNHSSVARPLLRLLIALSFVASTLQPAEAGDRVRTGYWKAGRAPDGWVLYETEHYQVQCAAGETLAMAVGAHAEAMLSVYRDMLPSRKKMPSFVIKIFADREGFLAYRPEASDFVAWYDKDEKELLAYDTGVMLGDRYGPGHIRLVNDYPRELSAWETERLDELFAEINDRYIEDLAGLVAHEAWHQYFHYYTVSWVAMPAWLDEGLGDYFLTARSDGAGGVDVGAVFPDGARISRQIIEDGIALPLGELFDLDQAGYYAEGWARYAQGWSVVHFLMHHDEAPMAELIPAYLKDFKKSKNFRKTNKSIFAGIDLEALDEQWRRWALSLPQDDPMGRLAERFAEMIGPGDLEAPQPWRDVYAWYRERALSER